VKSLRGFPNLFFSVLLFKSFLKEFFLWIRWFTTVDTRCKPWNLYGFQSFLGFHDFEQSSLNLLRIYIDLDSLTFLSKKEVSFSIHLCFIRRFELESSEILESDSVLLIFGLNSKNKSVTLLLLLHRFKSFELLSLFFSIFFLYDRVGFAAFSGEFPLEL